MSRVGQAGVTAKVSPVSELWTVGGGQRIKLRVAAERLNERVEIGQISLQKILHEFLAISLLA